MDLEWIALLYETVAAGNHSEAIDIIYANIETMLDIDVKTVDRLLLQIDLEKLSAEEIVALLIATLGVKSRLSNLPHFIECSHDILNLEEEGSDAVLAGLV